MSRRDSVEVWLDGERELFINMQRRLDGLGEAGRKALQTGGLQIVNDAKANLRNHGSVVTGMLRSSGKVQRVEGDEDSVDAGFFSDKTTGGYAFFVEYGRRSGKMPPPEELVEWVRKKNLNNRALDSAINILNGKRRTRKAKYSKADLLLSAAWGLAKWIAKKGTRPHPFFGPAVEKNKKAVVDAIAEAIKKEI